MRRACGEQPQQTATTAPMVAVGPPPAYEPASRRRRARQYSAGAGEPGAVPRTDCQQWQPCLEGAQALPLHDGGNCTAVGLHFRAKQGRVHRQRRRGVAIAFSVLLVGHHQPLDSVQTKAWAGTALDTAVMASAAGSRGAGLPQRLCHRAAKSATCHASAGHIEQRRHNRGLPKADRHSQRVPARWRRAGEGSLTKSSNRTLEQRKCK